MEGGLNKRVEQYESLRKRYVEECSAFSSNAEKLLRLKVIETIDSPIYAMISLSRGMPMESVDATHELIACEGLRTLSYDVFQETGDTTYRDMSYGFREKVYSKVSDKDLKRLISLEHELSTFWDLEKLLKERIRNKQPINLNLVNDFTLKKSSDVFAYFLLLNTRTHVPNPIRRVLFARQIERDLHDDMTDLLEDHLQGMPNPLLLRLYVQGFYDPAETYSLDGLKSLVDASAGRKESRKLVGFESWKADRALELYPKYSWMKFCS